MIIVQHLADSGSAYFGEGTPGAEIHPRIVAASPDATRVRKAFADGFVNTALDATLQTLGIEELLICGMMTQNCVTHTAISKSAEKYAVAIVSDCCTTVSQMIHVVALRAVSTRNDTGRPGGGVLDTLIATPSNPSKRHRFFLEYANEFDGLAREKRAKMLAD